MISPEKRNEFINRIRLGHTVQEACSLSGIPRSSMYRLLNSDPNLALILKESEEYATRSADQKNWNDMKSIALRKRN